MPKQKRLIPRRLWGQRLVFAAILVMGGAGRMSAETVIMQLKWRHQFQFAGYYAAIAQGYYAEVGLEVELREAEPGIDPVHAVLAGEADFGVGTSELLLLRSQGEPVVLLATIFQHSPLVLLTRRTAEISDLQALHDQPIMIEPQSAELFAYFRNEGIDPVHLQLSDHTFEVEDLLTGKVAAMSGYVTDEPFQLQQAGLDYLAFTPRAGGIDFYGDNVFTTEAQIRQHPERVRKFREASLRGWEYAMAHPEELVALIRSTYHSRKSEAHLTFEAQQMALLMHPGLIEVGHNNPGRWHHIAETYADFGMLPQPVDLSAFIYDPNPQPDYRWAYWVMGIVGALAIAAFAWVLPLWRLNRQLRAAKEAAEAADVAKGRYLAFMTHELRTPLNGIVGVISLLHDSPLNEDQQELIELLGQAAQNQLQLINGVLDFAKLESGQLELEKFPTDLPIYVNEIATLFRAAARTKGTVLQVEIAPELNRPVLVDPTRLRQILANLLSNAVKFTPMGEVGFKVGLDAATGTLQFAVSDTGIGMDSAAIAHLFTPYVQASASVGREYGGTGLGLAISRQLSEVMGGRIEVQSILGQGSTFTLTIPLEWAQA